MPPALVYSPEYDIHAFGLEKLHPFDTRKHSRAYEALRSELGDALVAQTCFVEEEVSDESLRLVHSDDYLNQLKSPAYLARALEVSLIVSLPFSLIAARVLRPMRMATMGTVIATRLALDNREAAVNLAGGYHHAGADKGEGFCLFADIPIAIADARRSDRLGETDRVLIIDLDAHQGNGFERVFMNDRRVFFLDAYNRDIYPQDAKARARIDFDQSLSSGTEDAAYLAAVEKMLKQAFDEADPHMVFYNAGTDVYEGDALGNLNITGTGVLKRDALVFSAVRGAGVPWVMVPSGGYSAQSYHLITNAVKLLF